MNKKQGNGKREGETRKEEETEKKMRRDEERDRKCEERRGKDKIPFASEHFWLDARKKFVCSQMKMFISARRRLLRKRKGWNKEERKNES